MRTTREKNIFHKYIIIILNNDTIYNHNYIIVFLNLIITDNKNTFHPGCETHCITGDKTLKYLFRIMLKTEKKDKCNSKSI